MRLAFAVAVHIRPEILLIDEVLAVGDISFQRKCIDKIAKFKEDGCAIMLVSHDITLMGELCDEALWLRKGEVVAQGPAQAVAEAYLSEMRTETQRKTPQDQVSQRTSSEVDLRVNENRFGSLEMEITEVRLLNAAGFPVTAFESGEAMQVEIHYSAPQEVPEPIFGVTISKEDGFVCYDASTEADGKLLSKVQGRGKISLYFERLDLIGGSYYIDVGAYCRDWAYAYDYHWHAYPLEVRPTHGEKGILRPPHRWEV